MLVRIIGLEVRITIITDLMQYLMSTLIPDLKRELMKYLMISHKHKFSQIHTELLRKTIVIKNDLIDSSSEYPPNYPLKCICKDFDDDTYEVMWVCAGMIGFKYNSSYYEQNEKRELDRLTYG